VATSKPNLDAVASALNSGAIHLLRSLRAVDRLAGQTPARLSALSVLVFGGPQTLGGLASQEGIAGPTMSRIVDALVTNGLAERRPHPLDARAVQVCATQAGESLTRAAARRRIETIAAALAQLPAAEQRRLAEASGLLDQVAAVIRARPAAGSADPDDRDPPPVRGRRGR
jgi:DNA-binding MarR family transcriptional regulator